MLLFVVLAEAATGAVLAAYPSIVVRLLFGETIAGAGVVMSRLGGLCLIALAVACWPERRSRHSYDGMLTWSAAALVSLIVMGLGGRAGMLLWPGAVAHAIIVVLLVRARSRALRNER